MAAVIDSDNAESFGSTVSVTVNNPLPAGTLLMLGLFSDDESATVTSLTDVAGNVYTVDPMLPNANSADGFTMTTAWCVLTNALGPGDTITFVATAGSTVLVFAAASGMAASPLDQSNEGLDDSFPPSGTCVSGNITTTQADEILFGWNIALGATGITTTPGWTGQDFDSPGAVAWYEFEIQIVSSVGTYSTGAVHDGTYWSSRIRSFKAAATGPAPEPTYHRSGLMAVS